MSVAINLTPDMYIEIILRWIEGGKLTVKKMMRVSCLKSQPEGKRDCELLHRHRKPSEY